MQKTFKRFLALLMTVMLIFSVVPTTVFAAEVPPEPENAASSEAPQEPDPTPLPEVTPEPSEKPAPTSTPEAAETVEPSPTPEPSAEPEDTELTPGTELDMNRIWPAIRRAQARAAASIGTSGTLYVGDYCFNSAVGVPPTLGEHIGLMPVETMKFGSNNVAAYCLEHSKESGDGMGYTWMDLTTNNQDTVGTILALGFQWNSPSNWAVPSDDSDKWIVTQVLIWEAIANHAFKQGNGLYGVESGVDADMQMISTHAHNPTKFMEYYRDLKKRLNDYLKVPSFASKEASKAKTITLRWDGSKYSATVTDTNSVLRNFTFENKIPGVKITTSGNSMTLSATEPILSPKTSPAIHNNMAAAGGKGAVAVWRTSDRDFQNFGTYNASGGDPVSCYIKVKTDAVGSAGLVKTSEDGKVSGISFRIDGSDGSSTTKTTDASGNIDIEGLPIYGADGSKITYTATEINLPNKYVKPESQTFQLTEGQTASIHFENKLKRWRVTVTKTDSKTGSTPQGNGSLKGATFGVYQGGTLVKEYTVGDDLSFTTDYFPYGEDWTLKEISAGEGYKVSTVVTDLCEIPSGSNEEFNDNAATATNEVIRGGISVEKRDSKTGKKPQGDADFSGIQFEIINKSKNPVEVNGKKAAPDEVAITITTNAQGVASTGPNCLPYGDYIIKEKTTNASMRKTFTKEIPVTVSEDGKVYTFTADNDVVRGGIAIQKRDSQTGEVPQGNADFAGIVFEVVNSSANAVVVGDETYAPGSVVATMTTDDNGYASTEDELLPYGRYTVREKSTNSSMLLTFREQTVNVTEDKKVYNVYADNDVVRGGLSVQKLDSQTGEKPQGDANFAGIVFEIINDSKNPVMVDGTSYAPGKVVKEITTNATGFATTGPNDLPYGDYLVREKSTNNSMLLTFTEEIPVTVSENGKVYPFTAENDVVRGGIEIQKHDSQTGTTPQGNADFAGIVFEVVNNSANPVVMDGKTIAPNEVAATITTDENGHASTADDALPFGRYIVREKETNKSMLLTWPEQEVTVSENKKMYAVTAVDDVVRGGLAVEKRDTITGSTPQGNADFEGITFEVINNSKNPVIVNDKSIAPGEVALTLTTDSEGKCSTANDALPYGEYILHEASTNESMLNTAPDQTVTIDEHLKMYTHYMDTLTDTVTYRNLIPGKTYQVKGVLMDKGTGEKLLVDGKEVTAEKEFTPDKPTGTVDIPFTFKGVSLAGKSIVVFENLYHEDVEVAVHADINDSDQTVEIAKPDEPSIKTKAAVNGEQKAHPIGEITIIDTVSYVNLTPGKTYTVKGVLMDKSTGEKLLIDGKEVTAEKEFTPDKATGTIDIPFTFDASAMQGKTVVVFEDLFHEDKIVASHADIDDTDQTITFDTPEIKTKATVDGEREADPLEKITLTDTVTYSNLTPGKTYTVRGVLMDKSTSKKLLIDGKETTAETEFTPDKSDGTVDLSFTFNASGLAGKSVVAFETLYHEGIEVAVHADIDDDDQTVIIREPKLKTTATIGGKKEASIAKELVLEDKVAYTGLTPGKEYTVKGVLMDKPTGKKFMVDGKEITAEATFTPEKSEGEVNVTFKFDGSKITAKTNIVVFETLYRDGKEIAAHADINDEGQTVTLTPEKPKTPDVPKTGDDRNITLPLILLGSSLAGLAVLFLFWFRRKKDSPQTGSKNDL